MKLPKIKYVEEKLPFVLNYLSGKDILHLGCVDFYLDEVITSRKHIHLELLSTAKKVYGVDYNREGLELLQTKFNVKNLFWGNVEELQSLDISEKFDIVFAGELIEHLNNPGLFLEGVKRFLGNYGVLFITTPNAYSLKTYLHLLFKKEQIETDHSLIFSFSTLYQLLKRYNFEVINYYTAIETQRSKKSNFAKYIFSLIYKIFPQYADKIILVCKIK